MNLPDNVNKFATEWLDAWNAHDLERLLVHFADDTVFCSPFVARLMDGSHGVVHGKDELRAYWVAGLAAVPDLHFELVNVYAGVDTVVINYRNRLGVLVNEVLTFTDGLVSHGEGTYLQ